MVHAIAVMALLLMPFYITANKEYLKVRQLFSVVQIQHSLSSVV